LNNVIVAEQPGQPGTIDFIGVSTKSDDASKKEQTSKKNDATKKEAASSRAEEDEDSDEDDIETDDDPGTAVSLSNVQAQHRQFAGNLDVSPSFVDLNRYNYGLTSSSPLRDAGRPLTQAREGGAGKVLTVADAAYFYDGFGIVGEVGDLVAVGSAQQVARVVKVDRRANTLTLDRSVRWKHGDPVSLSWGGAAPDIGVYEYGNNARPSVQIEVEPFVVRVGEKVRLRATLHGFSEAPTALHWQLGDGTEARGRELTHSYHSRRAKASSRSSVA
jgi:hypothetical protein